jgi:hypothetical protein
MVENARPSYPVSPADNVVRVLPMLQHAKTLRVATVANDLGVRTDPQGSARNTAHRYSPPGPAYPEIRHRTLKG